MDMNVFQGHFLTRGEVAQLIGCPSKEVTERADLLAISSQVSGHEIYPAMQFDRDGHPTPGLGRLIEQLHQHFDEVAMTSFCTCPAKTLGGRTPLDFLRHGGSLDRAVQAAAVA